MPIVAPPSIQWGWGELLSHLELVVVIRSFTVEMMRGYDPQWADAIYYPAPGTVLIADQREYWRRSGRGWQRVWTIEAHPVLKWVHPAVLGRAEVGLLVCGIRRTRFASVQEMNHNFPEVLHCSAMHVRGRFEGDEDHTGACEAVLQCKLDAGYLIPCVAGALRSLYMSPTCEQLCFVCKHDKHRSVAARTLMHLLCPRCSSVIHPHDRLLRCKAGCPPATVEQARRMVGDALTRSNRNG